MRRNTLRELRAYCRRVGPLIHAFTEASETVFRFLTAYDKREKGKRLSREDRRLLETGEALFTRHKAVCHDVLPQLGHVKCPPIAAACHWLIQDAFSDHCKCVGLWERAIREGDQSAGSEISKLTVEQGMLVYNLLKEVPFEEADSLLQRLPQRTFEWFRPVSPSTIDPRAFVGTMAGTMRPKG